MDSDTTTISSNIGHLLLEGPLLTSHLQADNSKVPLPGDHVFISNIDITDQSIKYTKNIIMLGTFLLHALILRYWAYLLMLCVK